jgi:DNA helicase-2/ATP-dependent DNA helicase PcrA
VAHPRGDLHQQGGARDASPHRELLGQPVGAMWVGTFHGLAHRLLRAHWKEAGLPQGFQILDSDDQLRLVKRLIREMNLDDAKWPPRQAQWFINQAERRGSARRAPRPRRRSLPAPDDRDLSRLRGGVPACRKCRFRRAAAACARAVARSTRLAGHYRERFGAILVDEFQDTNSIQYAWLRLLAGDADKLFVVGDDDQSIYGWRGARVENIQDFQTHYPNRPGLCGWSRTIARPATSSRRPTR